MQQNPPRAGALVVAFSLTVGLLSGEARNHVQNGEFDSGTSLWSLSLSNSAAATLGTSGSPASGFVDITNPGTTTSRSNVTLRQSLAAKFIGGTEYSVTFKAKAANSKAIDVLLYNSAGSIIWSQYSITVSTAETTYAYTYAASSDQAGGFLSFRLGGSGNGGDVYLDAIKVQNRLTWAPPTLVAPTAKTFTATDSYSLTSDDDDYILTLPAVVRTAGITLKGPYDSSIGDNAPGGRNIWMIGGQMEVPIGQSFTAITVRRGKVPRTVHVEGIKLTHQWDSATPTNSGSGDGLQNQDPSTTIQLQNFRCINLNGASNQNHTDFVQPYGGSVALRVDGLTGNSNYQGLFLNADSGSNQMFVFRNLNLTADPEWFAGAAGGHMIWHDVKSNGGNGVTTSWTNVYVTPRPGRALGYSVWPQTNDGDVVKRAVLAADGNSVSWPNWSSISGTVNKGAPPGGDFVTAADAGIGYVSPGYRSSSAGPLTMNQITFTSSTVPASAASGTVVSRADVDFTGNGHIIDLALTNNAGGRFSISGRNIRRTSTGTLVAGTSYSITVTATRRGSSPAQTISRTFGLLAQ